MNKLKHLSILASTFFSYQRRDLRCRHLPTRIWIEPTNACNLRCIMCPSSISKKKKGFMELDPFKKIIDETEEFTYDIMLYLGGESLLHPDIVQMVEYTSRAGLICQLNTNTTLLTQELSSSLIKAGLSRIVFSFDGYNKETYEKIRVGANFDKTLSNIVEFLKLKQELRSKKPEAIFQIIEFGKANEEEKRRFKNSLANLSLNRFKFISPHTFGGRFKEHDKVKGNSYAPCTFLWYSMSIL